MQFLLGKSLLFSQFQKPRARNMVSFEFPFFFKKMCLLISKQFYESSHVKLVLTEVSQFLVLRIAKISKFE